MISGDEVDDFFKDEEDERDDLNGFVERLSIHHLDVLDSDMPVNDSRIERAFSAACEFDDANDDVDSKDLGESTSD